MYRYSRTQQQQNEVKNGVEYKQKQKYLKEDEEHEGKDDGEKNSFINWV